VDNRQENRERGLDLSYDGPGLKRVAGFLALALALTLGVVVIKQMSAEAMAVVVGIICGVVASVPASLLLFFVLTRNGRRPEQERPAGERTYPPVVVIQGANPQALPPGMNPGYWPAPQAGGPAERQFHVVGNEDLVDADWRVEPLGRR
jgi:hypothetical protein